MRISDWSSDVCSSDLGLLHRGAAGLAVLPRLRASRRQRRPAAGPGAEGRPVPVAGDATDLRLRRRVRAAGADRAAGDQTGRESCRERVGQYVEISVTGVSLKTKHNTNTYVLYK